MKSTTPAFSTLGLFSSRSLFTLLSISLLGSSVVHAGTATWNNASNASWATAGNWTGATGGGIPTSADDVVLDNRNVTLPSAIGLDGAEAANSLTIGSSSGSALGAFTLEANSTAVTTARTLTLTTGNITLDSSVTGTGTVGGNASTNGVLTLATGATGFTIANNNTTQTLNIAGVLSGAAKTVTINSAGGAVELSGANTYTGATTLSTGVLEIGSSSAITSGAMTSGPVGTGTLTLAGGTTLEDNGSAQVIANAVKLSGTVTFAGSGGLTFSRTSGGNSLTSSNPVTMTATTNFNVTNSATTGLTIVDPIGDGGSGYGLTKSGLGVLTLSGSNTYTGATTINNGTLAISSSGPLTITGGAASALGQSSNIASNLVIGGGTLQNANTGGTTSTDHLFTIGNASGNNATLDNSTSGANAQQFNFTNTGAIAFGSNAAHTLTLTGVTTKVNSFAPILGDDTTDGTATSLIKLGSDSWTLSGSNTYSGGTSVKAGTLNFASNTALGAATSTVTLGDTASSTAGAAISSSGAFTLANSIIVAAGSSGTLTLSASGGTASYTGNVTLDNNLTIGPGNGYIVTMAGSTITSGATGTQTLTLDPSTGNGRINISNIIGGGTGVIAVVKTDTSTGTTTLTGANTYTGGTTVNDGILTVGTGGTLGATTGSLAVNNTNTGVGNASVLNLATAVDTTVGSLSGTISAPLSGSNTATINNGGTGRNFTVNQTTAGTFAGVIAGTGKFTLGSLSTGTLTLSGVNTYTGTTTIAAGTLNVTGSLASGSSVSVGGAVTATLAGTGTVNGAVTTTSAGGGVAHIAPGTVGTVGTLHIGSLGLSIGNGTSLDFDLNTGVTAGGTNDLIALGGGTLSFGGTTTINFDVLSALTTAGTGTYTLINGATSITGFNSSNFIATGLTGQTATFSSSGGALLVAFTNSAVTTYYYTGGTSTDFTDYHNYNTLATTAGGGVQQTTALSSTSDVTIGTTTPTPSNLTPVANSNITIDSLTFASSGAGATLSGTGTVTLASSTTALNDNATGGTTETISAGLGLGASQTWTVSNASNTLAVSGKISGGNAVTLSGPGSFNFSNGSNSYSGGTTVNSNAKLFVANSTGTTVLGTGTLTVQKGATFGGAGNASGLAAFNIGSGGTGTTTLLVGSGGTDTTSSLTLQATGASTIASTNLTFNLSTTGGGNQLKVGTTLLGFSSGDTLTLNLVGINPISANTPYILIAGTGGDGSGTLAGSQFSGLGSGGLDANGHVIITGLTLAFTGSEPPSWYSNSYIFLVNNGGVDDLEVEVVPEPSTWALMFGGLAALVFWQRRKGKQV